MKKRVLIPLLAAMLALGLMLTACGTKTNTVTYGQVGVENHCYFPYATVTVNDKGVATSVELGEAFGPTGKLMASNGAPVYRNPWYPGISKISTKIEEQETLAQKQELVANKYYISIDGKVFVLSVERRTIGDITCDALIFVGKDDGLQLADSYLAENIKWYVDAIKADKVFICDENGTRLGASDNITLPDDSVVSAKFMDGALLKNDNNSTYQPTRGLSGAHFKQAMEEMAAFAKDKNFVIEYEEVEKGGNWQGLRVKGLTLSVHGEADGVTGATATDAATFLNYAASYMKVAEAAFARAKA